MMLGLGYLSFFSYYIKRKEHRLNTGDSPLDITGTNGQPGFDLFRKIAKAEWDTLLFFYGVILCVGGLGQFGYLAMASNFMYHDLGATTANVMVGILSAIVDNIPVMFAVLTMDPQMSHGQWLLVTLTAGVGGSLLSIGSAAGVALMGSARGIYTFGQHLKWTWAIALGYAASILVHLWINVHHM
jgi:Na+/H+ antiporter NhaD/arsenite permease-like protein